MFFLSCLLLSSPLVAPQRHAPVALERHASATFSTNQNPGFPE